MYAFGNTIFRNDLRRSLPRENSTLRALIHVQLAPVEMSAAAPISSRSAAVMAAIVRIAGRTNLEDDGDDYFDGEPNASRRRTPRRQS
jgi:hypothetical protein